MKTLVFVIALLVPIAVVTSQVQELERIDINDGLGNFRSFYRLSDGTIFEKIGVLRNPGTPDEELVIYGYYYYIAPDGEAQLTEYTADKTGYHKKTSKVPGAFPPRMVATMVG